MSVKVLGYARVSLESEKIENQALEIERFAKENSLDLLQVFQDIGVSGSKPALERDGFKKMLEVAEALNVKTVVVYDLTRLGRDLFDLIETLKLLYEKGYVIFFVKHPELNAQPDNPIGQAIRKAIITMLGVVAELERAFIIERTKAGLERAKKIGKKLGRKPVEIPEERVSELLRKGLSKKDVWRILIDMGYLKYTEKGKEKTLNYITFLRRLKIQMTKRR